MASLPSDTETEHYEHPEQDEGREGRSPRGVSRGSLALMIAGFALVAAVLVGALAGLRAFIMETPSMGTAAPVGSLVLTAPAQTGDLSVGDIVTFKQDGAKETHTHRVIAAGKDGVRTK
ncbi:S26 family signal peptidase, partial [Arthrobacter sp. UM1]|uniref:S26 family signal peptidase n=1 Tax=Arthrobacter sp. UM1 TaxID=2766776 RepID=UPI001CF65243